MPSPNYDTRRQQALAWTFRIVLLASAASLAAYIPYKYATQLHAINGVYAFLFPLSGILAAAGLVFAMRPQMSCDCNAVTRSGLGALSLLWMATGLLCVSNMTRVLLADPVDGSIAFFHMGMQHVFLSLSLLAFAFMPHRIVTMLVLRADKPSEELATSSQS